MAGERRAQHAARALYGVDFEIEDTSLLLDEPYRTQLKEVRITLRLRK
jgi:hypothetical protein